MGGGGENRGGGALGASSAPKGKDSWRPGWEMHAVCVDTDTKCQNFKKKDGGDNRRRNAGRFTIEKWRTPLEKLLP